MPRHWIRKQVKPGLKDLTESQKQVVSALEAGLTIQKSGPGSYFFQVGATTRTYINLRTIQSLEARHIITISGDTIHLNKHRP